METDTLIDKEEDPTTDLDLTPAPLSDEMFKQVVTSAPADMFATNIVDQANARVVANEFAPTANARANAQRVATDAANAANDRITPMPNTNKIFGGIPTSESILINVGDINTKKLRSHKEYAGVLTAIDEYHTLCAEEHVIKHSEAVKSDTALSQLNKLESLLKKCYKTYNKRSSTKRKLIPIYTNILASINPLKARFANLDSIAFAYALNTDTGLTNYKVGDILDSKWAKMQGANAVTKTGQALTETTESKNNSRLASQIENTIIPSHNSPNFYAVLGEVENALALLDTQGDFANELTLYNYYPLRRLIASVKNNPDIISKLADSNNPKQLSDHDNKDYISIGEFATGSFTVADANKNLAQKQSQSIEQTSSGAKELGGGLKSKVWLDPTNKRILRESSGATDVDIQMKQGNAYRDEALSKLNELLDFNVVAKARTTKYKDMTGKESFGSEMALGQGKEGNDFRITTSTADADKGASDDTKDEMNLGSKSGMRVACDLIKLQLVDFIAASRDRHAGNFFINPQAAEGESTVTGIDNDLCFGKTAEFKAQNHTLSVANEIAKAEDGIYGADSVNATGLNGLSFIPMGTMAKLEKITPETLKSVLGPYIPPFQVAAAIKRLNILKSHLKSNSTELDFNKPESQKLFKEAMDDSVFNYVAKRTNVNEKGEVSRSHLFARGNTGSAIMAGILSQYDIKANSSTSFALKVLLMGKTKEDYAAALEANGAIDEGKGTAAELLKKDKYIQQFDTAKATLNKLIEESGASDFDGYTARVAGVAEDKRLKTAAEEKKVKSDKAAQEKKATA